MMTPTELAFLRDKSAATKLPTPSPDEAAKAMLRLHVLAQLSNALERANERAMVVKGASLAETVYPDRTLRPMHDIDLLVPPHREHSVVAALSRAGMVVCRNASRPQSERALGETQLIAQAGALTMLVEVHPTLDKIVPRPLDIDAIERRSTKLRDFSRLLVPSPEDHALLVAAHAASHEMRHDLGLLDMELLLRRGLDRNLLCKRAQEAKLRTVMFVVLSTMKALGAASVDEALVDAFTPSPKRRAALGLFYDVGRYPVASGQTSLGAAWIVRQAPLRDDLAGYFAGLVRYAGLRLLDYGLTRLSSRPKDPS